jgi:subtilisin family serine protease
LRKLHHDDDINHIKETNEMKRLLTVAIAAVLSVMIFAIVPIQKAELQEKYPKIRRSEQKIPGKYIVMFEDSAAGSRGVNSNAEAVSNELAAIYGGKVENVYKHALNGYSTEMSEKEMEALSRDPRVKFVEEDGMATASTTQTGATWGIDRIDQRNLPVDTNYNYNADGTGVTAFVLDTGVLSTHEEFGGRVIAGYSGNFANTEDCNGHGTHVAGTLGGATYGVAKNVTIVPVRVLGCTGTGSFAAIIAGVDWVTANHSGPSVANMSLGGPKTAALDLAVNNSINSGITYAVAAGNSLNGNACLVSPAGIPAVITVSATDINDVRPLNANIGFCVDIFAPGVNVTSAWFNSPTATNTISGTSMASPHVAGAAALYLQTNPTASAADVTFALQNNATPDKVINPLSFNLLLYTGFITPPPTIAVNPASMSFAAVAGGANPASQALNITNTGGGTLNWTATSDATWLSATPATGTGAGSPAVSVNIAGLSAGTYTGNISITATSATNSGVTVPITLNVEAAPTIAVNPGSMSFNAIAGGANPASQTLDISNTGGGVLNWSATSNAAWLTTSPASGTGAGSTTVAVNIAGLSAGTYNGTISVSATGATNSPVAVPVTLTITGFCPGTNLVQNPGFETSKIWVYSGASRNGDNPHSGLNTSRYLNKESNVTHTAYQTLSIPAGCSPNLSFWLNVVTLETTTTAQNDRIFVEVRSSSGVLLGTLATFSNLDKTASATEYIQRGTYNLGAYSGQTIRLQFRATSNGSLGTIFRVDDVVLQ